MVAQIELLHPVRAAVYAADGARLTLHLHLVAEGFLAQIETLCRFFVAFDEDGHRFICDLVVFADALNQNGVFTRLLPDGQRGQLALNFRLRGAAGHVEHRVRLFAVDAGGAAVLILDNDGAAAAALTGEHAFACRARLGLFAGDAFRRSFVVVIRLAVRFQCNDGGDPRGSPCFQRHQRAVQLRLAARHVAAVADNRGRADAVCPSLEISVNRAALPVVSGDVAFLFRADGHVAVDLAIVDQIHAPAVRVAAHATVSQTVVGQAGLAVEIGFRAHRAGLAVVGDGER